MNLKDYRTRGYFIALMFSVAIIIVGNILSLTKVIIHGVTLPNGRLGTRSFQPVNLSGSWLIIIGMLLGYYPAYLLFFKKKED